MGSIKNMPLERMWSQWWTFVAPHNSENEATVEVWEKALLNHFLIHDNSPVAFWEFLVGSIMEGLPMFYLHFFVWAWKNTPVIIDGRWLPVSETRASTLSLRVSSGTFIFFLLLSSPLACQPLNGRLSQLTSDVKWLWVTVPVSVASHFSRLWWQAAGKLVPNL